MGHVTISHAHAVSGGERFPRGYELYTSFYEAVVRFPGLLQEVVNAVQ